MLPNASLPTQTHYKWNGIEKELQNSNSQRQHIQNIQNEEQQTGFFFHKFVICESSFSLSLSLVTCTLIMKFSFIWKSFFYAWFSHSLLMIFSSSSTTSCFLCCPHSMRNGVLIVISSFWPRDDRHFWWRFQFGISFAHFKYYCATTFSLPLLWTAMTWKNITNWATFHSFQRC